MKNNKEDHFQVLRKIHNNPETSQRDLAQALGFSLGKLNYCLKALEQKGFVKIQNLKKKKNKLKYIQQYVLTPEGITLRTRLK